jgi:hypothetical protein
VEDLFSGQVVSENRMKGESRCVSVDIDDILSLLAKWNQKNEVSAFNWLCELIA